MKALIGLSVALVVVTAVPTCAMAADPPRPAVIELFEDDADLLIPELTNQSGEQGTATREDKDRFTGVCSLRVTPLQRYTPQVKGWYYKIKAKPELGEYRYVRFAWKKAGGNGIMIQFCGNTDSTGWEHRYLSGTSSVGWATRELDEKAPADWKLVTCDLHRDFGNFILTGIAFTPMDGTAAYFDHIYLGRSIADLDKVTEAAQGKVALKEALTRKQLDKLWDDLNDEDAAVRVPASATLIAGKKETVSFLREKLYSGPGKNDEEKVAALVAQLDDDDFNVRAKAEKELSVMSDSILIQLRRSLQTTTSAEVRFRLDRILKERGASVDPRPTADQKRIIRALRVLEQCNTTESRKLLEELSKSSMDEALKPEVKAAMKRLEGSK